MRIRNLLWRVSLAVALTLSLAIGGGLGMAAASSTAFSPSATSTLAPLNPAPVPAAHVGGMRHGQDTGGGTVDLAQQVLCAIACMGLTAAPGVPALDFTLIHQPLTMAPDISVADTSDQILRRPTAPPPRARAII